MKNFKEYAKNKNENVNGSAQTTDNIEDTVKKYSEKSESELYSELFSLAEKGKKDGTFNENSIKEFEQTLAPVLNDEQKAKLEQILNSLRKI